VAVAPAVVRRDGRVQAGGHPADHARLGLAEERLDELCGSPGVIDEIARTVLLDGKVKGAARRALTPALAIRLTLLMTLMPDADYAEVMAALLGDLPLVPWQRPYQVPTATVACTWREALGLRPLERLRDAGWDRRRAPGPRLAGRPGRCPGGVLDRRVADPGARQRREPAGLRVGGTADGSSPYPQLRELRCSQASTRATLAVAAGPSGADSDGGRDKGEAEQVLLDKAVKDSRHVFTPAGCGSWTATTPVCSGSRPCWRPAPTC
jgi:hypothetical protein